MSIDDQDLLGDLPEQASTLGADDARWPARMAEMTDLAIDEIAASGLVSLPQQHRALAVRIVTRMCREFGGGREYWPKVDAVRRALRDAAIWAEHDGTRDGPRGITMLARKHRLSDVQIWNILRAQRALHRERVQGRLNLPAPGP